MAGSKAKQMVKHSSLYAIGNISRQLVGFIMLPIYTRYLSPADYGVVGLLIFSLNLVDLLFGARLTQAIPKFFHSDENSDNRNIVISTALIATSVISAVTTLVVVYYSEAASNLIFGKSDLSAIVMIYSVLILTQAIENYGLLFIRLKQQPYLFLFFSLCKLFVQLGFNIWFVVILEMGVLGIAYTSAISSILFACILLFHTLYHTKLLWSNSVAKKLMIFSWPLWVSGVAALYLGSANRYYMRIYGSLDDIGLYELAAKFSAILTFMIWRPIFQYWETERFKYYEKDKPASNIYNTVFLSINTLMVLAGLGISIFAEPVIEIMAPASYHLASQVVPILVLAALLTSFSTYFRFSLLVTDNTKWIGKNTYYVAFIATVFFVVLIPSYQFIGAAYAYFLAMLIQLYMTIKASNQYYNLKVKLKPMVYMILVSIFSYYIANHIFTFDSIIFDFAYKSLVYLIFSMVILFIMWKFHDDREYLSKLITKLSPSISNWISQYSNKH